MKPVQQLTYIGEQTFSNFIRIKLIFIFLLLYIPTVIFLFIGITFLPISLFIILLIPYSYLIIALATGIFGFLTFNNNYRQSLKMGLKNLINPSFVISYIFLIPLLLLSAIMTYIFYGLWLTRGKDILDIIILIFVILTTLLLLTVLIRTLTSAYLLQVQNKKFMHIFRATYSISIRTYSLLIIYILGVCLLFGTILSALYNVYARHGDADPLIITIIFIALTFLSCILLNLIQGVATLLLKINPQLDFS